MKQIPNLFTLANLFFGCIAIVYILQYDPKATGLNLSGISLIVGSIFIFLAACIDFLDGFVARLFKATSEMGAQLDSLADVVSFGVAPGMILYKMLEAAYVQNQVDTDSMWILLPAFLLPCAAAWRLAKFNLDKEQRYYFKGLPTPAAGLFVASLPLIDEGVLNIQGLLGNPYVLYGLIFVLGGLMVSNIPMISLKFKSKKLRDNVDKLAIVLISILAILLFRWGGLPVILIAYIVVSLLFKPDREPIG